MQVNPSNNQSTFKGAYKVPYTEEGAKLLRSKLNKNYNGAMDSIQLCLGNKTELQFLGIGTGIMVPDPVPLTTSLFSLAIANPKLIEGGNPNNVIKIMEGHHPDTNDFVRAVGFSLFQWVTKSEAKWVCPLLPHFFLLNLIFVNKIKFVFKFIFEHFKYCI